MPAIIGIEDLAPFADIDPIKAQAMIDDALALAARVAPCITETDFAHADAAKAIIRGAVLRWNDSGSGAVTQQTTGPFAHTVDTRQTRRGMFWPVEIADLQALCSGEETGDAYAVDTLPYSGSQHADICAVRFGATYCSCGAVLTGDVPLYETSP